MEPDEKYGQISPENVAGAETQAWTTAVDDDDEEGGVVEIEGEAVLELMRRLEEEISVGGGAACWGCPFVTINGNEESCGPSFSDTSTTVMASFDLTTGVPALTLGSGGGMVECGTMEAGINESWLVQAEGIFWPPGDGGAMDSGLGGGGEESEEEWLDRVLNSGEFEALEE